MIISFSHYNNEKLNHNYENVSNNQWLSPQSSESVIKSLFLFLLLLLY